MARPIKRLHIAHRTLKHANAHRAIHPGRHRQRRDVDRDDTHHANALARTPTALHAGNALT
jgi:hypothetical protein